MSHFQYAWHLVCYFLYLFCPLPLSISIAYSLSRRASRHSIAQWALISMLLWCACQSTLGVGLGFLGLLNKPALMMAQAILFFCQRRSENVPKAPV